MGNLFDKVKQPLRYIAIAILVTGAITFGLPKASVSEWVGLVSMITLVTAVIQWTK